MCRSLFRITVATAFVLALVLTTVPAQALPLDTGSSALTLDTSWLDAAFSWLQGLLVGDEGAQVRSMTAASGMTTPPTSGTLSGSCIDPMGGCRPGGGGGSM